jgi:hypothetical protein
MADRSVEEEWKKVAIVGYCPLMSHGAEMVDCKKERCSWWRGAGPGRPQGKGACAVNDIVSQLGALNTRFPISIQDLVTQLVILNGRIQTLAKEEVKK